MNVNYKEKLRRELVSDLENNPIFNDVDIYLIMDRCVEVAIHELEDRVIDHSNVYYKDYLIRRDSVKIGKLHCIRGILKDIIPKRKQMMDKSLF